MSGRVLVVDDSRVIRQLIKLNLELEGFEVTTAVDGADCLDVVHQMSPDVITLDRVMPRLDGMATASRLRADPRTSHVPLALVSASAPPGPSGEGGESQSGEPVFDAFLAKPFDPADLVRMVRQLTGFVPGDSQTSRGGELPGGTEADGDVGDALPTAP